MASSSQLTNKLSMHSTKIPLSERFKMVRQKAMLKKNLGGGQSTNLGNAVSKKNRILARRMASKPSVLAALKLKKKSIRQRLGGPNRPIRNLFVGRRAAVNKSSDISSRLQSRPNTAPVRVRLNRSNFIGNKPAPRGRNNRIGRNNQASSSRNVTARYGSQRGRGKIRGRNISNRGSKQGNNTNVYKRNNPNTRPRKNLSGRGGRLDNRRGIRGGVRGARGGRGNYRGGRGGRGRGGVNQNYNQDNRYKRSKQRFQTRWNKRRANLDKNKLDTELDKYMAKTRNQLDADLDAYMGKG